MIPPFERQHAKSMTRHHLLFEKPEWKASQKSREVHEMGAYVVGAVRFSHDYLHLVVRPVIVPGVKVLDVMHDLGHEYASWHNDADRTSKILDNIAYFARTTRSPQQANEAIQVATSIEAQMSLLGFMNNIGLLAR